jgi:8-oxo-dGTP pyrophosphatase MutT (NUDIX family)
VLLFRGGDPGRSEAGTWWFPAGGGVEPGESLEAAARREVLEETGRALADVGEVVHVRTIEFEFDGVTYLQDEHYFVVTVERFEVSSASWTDLERRVVVEHRWWSRDELDDTHDTVFPEGLGELLGAVTSTRS